MAIRWMTLGVVLLAAAGVGAQENAPEPGARPPVMSVRDVMQQARASNENADSTAQRQVGVPGLSTPVPEPAAAPPATFAVEPPTSDEEAPEKPPVARGVIDENARATEARRVAPTAQSTAQRAPNRPFVKPAPHQMVVNSGENHVVGIAFSHLNRIITPFAKPVVKTTSVATTSVEGSIVYIATNMSEPVGLFIHEEARPELAISLTMVPAEIPPISTNITVNGMGEAGSARVAPKHSLATEFEQQHTYLEMLKVLFRDLAMGRVPDGYGFEEVSGIHPDMPRCEIPGVHVVPLQLLTGSSLRAFVARAQNTSHSPREVSEAGCSERGVRAVAAWPRTRLMPGEATELYVVLDVPSPEDAAPQRPSLLGDR